MTEYERDSDGVTVLAQRYTGIAIDLPNFAVRRDPRLGLIAEYIDHAGNRHRMKNGEWVVVEPVSKSVDVVSNADFGGGFS